MVASAPRHFVSLHELQLDGITYALGVESNDEGFSGCWGCESCESSAQESLGDATRDAAERRAREHLVAHHALFHLADVACLSGETHNSSLTW